MNYDQIFSLGKVFSKETSSTVEIKYTNNYGYPKGILTDEVLPKGIEYAINESYSFTNSPSGIISLDPEEEIIFKVRYSSEEEIILKEQKLILPFNINIIINKDNDYINERRYLFQVIKSNKKFSLKNKDILLRKLKLGEKNIFDLDLIHNSANTKGDINLSSNNENISVPEEYENLFINRTPDGQVTSFPDVITLDEEFTIEGHTNSGARELDLFAYKGSKIYKLNSEKIELEEGKETFSASVSLSSGIFGSADSVTFKFVDSNSYNSPLFNVGVLKHPFSFFIDTSIDTKGNYFCLPLIQSESSEEGYFPEYYYEFDFYVDWGDGSPREHVTSFDDIDHTYSEDAVYNIKIYGSLDNISFGFAEKTDASLVTSIESWGMVNLFNSNVKSISGLLMGCKNLTSIPNSFPDLSHIKDFSFAFSSVPNNFAIPYFDSSNGLKFSGMFEGFIDNSNGPVVPNIDTSNGKDFSGMFHYQQDENLDNLINLDFSNGENFNECFADTLVTDIPDLSITSKSSSLYQGMFIRSTVETIGSFNLGGETEGTAYLNMFKDCDNLIECNIQGYDNDVDFSDCSNIPWNKRNDIFNNLAVVSKTRYISMPSYQGEQEAIATNKGWIVN